MRVCDKACAVRSATDRPVLCTGYSISSAGQLVRPRNNELVKQLAVVGLQARGPRQGRKETQKVRTLPHTR